MTVTGSLWILTRFPRYCIISINDTTAQIDFTSFIAYSIFVYNYNIKPFIMLPLFLKEKMICNRFIEICK